MSGYSPILELGDDPLTPRESLTRPVVGIENRTAQEVFDIMSDRFRAHLTALASGSGDQLSGNPGILKSGDHAELIGVLRADRLPECSFDDGKTWELDGVGVAETFSRAADALDALLAENAALREKVRTEIKLSVDNYVRATARATEAERKLAEAVGLLRKFHDAWRSGCGWLPSMNALDDEITAFLSKEAERG